MLHTRHGARFVCAWRLDSLLPGYTTVDQRLAWRPMSHLELSAGVRNLFDQQHLEFPVEAHGIRTRVLVGRTGYGKLTWRF